jgi:hypothetical protein
VKKCDQVVQFRASHTGEGWHPAAQAALMNQFGELGIFNPAQATRNLRTVLATESVASVTDGAIVVIDLPTGLLVALLRLHKAGEKQQTSNDRRVTWTQADSFRAQTRPG